MSDSTFQAILDLTNTLQTDLGTAVVQILVTMKKVTVTILNTPILLISFGFFVLAFAVSAFWRMSGR